MRLLILSCVLSVSGHAIAAVEALPDGSIRFSAPFPHARVVQLAGEFSAWGARPALLEREGERFVGTLYLDHGLHEYKFIVDGNWLPDPENPARSASESGQPNSVFWLNRDGRLELRSDVPDDLALDVRTVLQEIPLVILWQQHQPWLGDPGSDCLLGPWLRLHATKDYLDMALRLKDQPTVRAGISLSGTLLFQLDRYYLNRLVPFLDHGTRTVDTAFSERWTGRTDPWLDLLLRDGLDPTDPVQAGLLWKDDWSCLSLSSELRSHWPRLDELTSMVRAGLVPNSGQAQELLMLYHLAWMDPRFLRAPVSLVTGHELRVCDLVQPLPDGRWTARAWDAGARRRLAYETGLILEAVIPEHAALMGAGSGVRQVELATTPFAHPILPLLLDTRSAAARQPEDTLPDLQQPEYARRQVELAVAQYRSLAGRDPLGMWPGEGALDPRALALLGQAGLGWTATGDNMPAADLPGTGSGFLRVSDAPDVLLRETALSRSLGWRYRLYPGRAAATDLVNRLLERGRQAPGRVLVLVLDGENAWEFYQRDPDADQFLDTFYALLASPDLAGRIRTLAPSDVQGLESMGPALDLSLPALRAGLAAGSWIDGDLRTWIGEAEENLAWQLLDECTAVGPVPPAADLLPLLGAEDLFQQPAGRVISTLLAEGSDWFWWYGQDREAFEGDGRWDELFLQLLRTMSPHRELPATLLQKQRSAGTAGRTLD
ncbi:MAG: hypothetical protein H6678_07370 [Candidatus Delongbacteria bacterium]|nr:hypothetical protein [Candidatus Delongbacteria bacterium]